jgi:peptidoglycan/LPS O-acetylase OafA/YrhL
MGKTIAELIEGRDNNFNLIRFLAASAVVCAHVYFLLGREGGGFSLYGFTEADLSVGAVNVFFVVSGFLITRSLLGRGDLAAYVAARALRLVPALAVTSAILVFILGPLVSSVPLWRYIADPAAWLYLVVTPVVFEEALPLPGVFQGVPVEGIVNGPLWTLRYEAIAYGAVAAFWLAGAFSTRLRGAVTAVGLLAAFFAINCFTDLRTHIGVLDSTVRFGILFTIGGIFYGLREKIRPNLPVLALLTGLAAATWPVSALQEFTTAIAVGYGVFWLAYSPGGILLQFNECGDYSYGLYIIHWPVLQTVIWLVPGNLPADALFLAVYPATLTFAVLSWHYVEKPALALRQPVTDLLHRIQAGLYSPGGSLRSTHQAQA